MNCLSKKIGFKTKAEAEKAGMKVYKCRWCHRWHRTGKIVQIANPVLRILIAAASLWLIGCEKPQETVAAYDYEKSRVCCLLNCEEVNQRRKELGLPPVPSYDK